MRAAIGDASAKGAQVVVFPELAVTGYGAREALEAIETGDNHREWQSACEEFGVVIVLGLAQRIAGKLVNAASILRPGHNPVTYSKRCLYGPYENEVFVSGNEAAPVVEIGGLKVGVLICFDVEFPELVRDLALRGADAVLVPTALPKTPSSRFIAKHMIRVRAFENQLFVVYANHCGADARFAYEGMTQIVAPDGAVLAGADAQSPSVVIGDLNPSVYVACAQDNPYLSLCRPLVTRE